MTIGTVGSNGKIGWGEGEKVVLYYCPDCQGLVFQWITRATQYGKGEYIIDENGNHEEVDFECDETHTYEKNCIMCDTALEEDLVIPLALYKLLYNSVKNKLDKPQIFYIKLENIGDITDENLVETLFEALI